MPYLNRKEITDLITAIAYAQERGYLSKSHEFKTDVHDERGNELKGYILKPYEAKKKADAYLLQIIDPNTGYHINVPFKSIKNIVIY